MSTFLGCITLANACYRYSIGAAIAKCHSFVSILGKTVPKCP